MTQLTWKGRTGLLMSAACMTALISSTRSSSFSSRKGPAATHTLTHSAVKKKKKREKEIENLLLLQQEGPCSHAHTHPPSSGNRKEKKERKVYAVRRHDGSLCTQKQPEAAVICLFILLCLHSCSHCLTVHHIGAIVWSVTNAAVQNWCFWGICLLPTCHDTLLLCHATLFTKTCIWSG